MSRLVTVSILFFGITLPGKRVARVAARGSRCGAQAERIIDRADCRKIAAAQRNRGNRVHRRESTLPLAKALVVGEKEELIAAYRAAQARPELILLVLGFRGCWLCEEVFGVKLRF